MVSVCFRLLQIINLKIFQIGAFSRLASDWFQTGFRLAWRISDCVFRFQIASDCFQIHFRLVWKNSKSSDFVFTSQIASDWLEPRQRRRTLPPPQPPRRIMSCDGKNWNGGRRLRLPTWRDWLRLRWRWPKSPRGKWRGPLKNPRSKPPPPKPPLILSLPRGPRLLLIPYLLPRPRPQGLLLLLVVL